MTWLSGLLGSYWGYAVAGGSIVAAIFAYLKQAQEMEKLRLERRKLLLEIQQLEWNLDEAASNAPLIERATFEQTLRFARGEDWQAAARELILRGNTAKVVKRDAGRGRSSQNFTPDPLRWAFDKSDSVFSLGGLVGLPTYAMLFAAIVVPQRGPALLCLSLALLMMVPTFRRNLELFRLYCLVSAEWQRLALRVKAEKATERRT